MSTQSSFVLPAPLLSPSSSARTPADCLVFALLNPVSCTSRPFSSTPVTTKPFLCLILSKLRSAHLSPALKRAAWSSPVHPSLSKPVQSSPSQLTQFNPAKSSTALSSSAHHSPAEPTPAQLCLAQSSPSGPSQSSSGQPCQADTTQVQ